jgi:hypothetical protein
VIEIGERHAPTVPDVIATGGTGNIIELTVAKIQEEELPFPAIPGVLRHKPFAEEFTVFILIEQCDRTAKER